MGPPWVYSAEAGMVGGRLGYCHFGISWVHLDSDLGDTHQAQRILYYKIYIMLDCTLFIIFYGQNCRKYVLYFYKANRFLKLHYHRDDRIREAAGQIDQSTGGGVSLWDGLGGGFSPTPLLGVCFLGGLCASLPGSYPSWQEVPLLAGAALRSLTPPPGRVLLEQPPAARPAAGRGLAEGVHVVRVLQRVGRGLGGRGRAHQGKTRCRLG